MTRPLNIEEAWVENAAYLFAFTDNNLAAGHTVGLEGEADFAVNDRLGGEVDFPQVFIQEPVGHAPSILGPVATGVRYVPFRYGTTTSASAGLCAVEVEGAVAPVRSASFPGLGNNWTAEILGGLRYGVLSVQGIYGTTRPLGTSGQGGWFANTSFALHLGSTWVIQVEDDLAGNFPADDRLVVTQRVVVPELGLQTGEWTLEAGLELSSTFAESTSILMLEHDL